MSAGGYVLVLVGKSHHLANKNGYAWEHRLIAEQMLGRRLLRTEVVHHKDHNKQNNDPANLEVLRSAAHHGHEHGMREDRRHPDAPNEVISCSCGCGQSLLKFDPDGRPRNRVYGHLADWMPEDKKAAARADAAAGMSWAQLAAKHGEKKGRLRLLCKDDHKDRRRLVSPEMRKRLKELRAQGLSLSQIMEATDLPKTTVARHYK